MEKIPEEGKILGYKNPIHTTPVPVITIYESNKIIYARFPDSTSAQLVNFEKSSELHHVETQEKYISKNQYSYLFTDDTVLTRSPEIIKSELEKAVTSMTTPISNKKISQEDKELIEDFLSTL